MPYNPKYLQNILAYQRRLRAEGKYRGSRATPETLAKFARIQYVNNTVACIKYMFNRFEKENILNEKKQNKINKINDKNN